jgi:DNA replication protein DnaC
LGSKQRQLGAARRPWRRACTHASWCLAIALGKRICDEGASTRFFSTNLFFEEASAEKTAGKYQPFIRNLAKTAVLILDDFALCNYTHDEANILLEVIEER